MTNMRVLKNVVALIAAVTVVAPSLAIAQDSIDALEDVKLQNCGVGYIKAMKVLSTRNKHNTNPISIYVTLDGNGWPDPAFDNNAYYVDPEGRRWITINGQESQKRWELARSTLQSAMLARMPVAMYTRTKSCNVYDDQIEITACSDEYLCSNTG